MQHNDGEDSIQLGRLAIRQEGNNWNAYYTTDTMEGAIFLGSVKLALITGRPDIKNAFMDLMRECATTLIEEATGTKPNWGAPTTAPAHERAGNA